MKQMVIYFRNNIKKLAKEGYNMKKFIARQFDRKNRFYAAPPCLTAI